MDILEITIQRRIDKGWPVVIEYRPANELTIRREGLWEIGTDEIEEIEGKLLPYHRDPSEYGKVLGRALFQNEVRDLFREARSRTQDYLRVLLVIEAPELKKLHWEWLSGPIRMGGKWGLLGLDQRLPFSLYLPSVTERHFPPIAKHDLRALLVVANPPKENGYGLATFEQSKTISGAFKALDDIPITLLANSDGALSLPTVNHLATQLSGEQYTLLYIIAHGKFQEGTGETTLYLLDDQNGIKPIAVTAFLERLDMLQGQYGLPHFVFLATCESADPKAEALGALGGLAQRMVRDLGIPAVIAMTQKVSIETANALGVALFARLREHGEIDRALVEACAGLADRGDIAVPTLYSRLEGRPLFQVNDQHEPTAGEVKVALNRLDELLKVRCPILYEQYQDHAQKIRDVIDTAHEALSKPAQRERQDALDAINQLCEENLDLSFQDLALGQEPPLYHAHECPFPGLYAFQTGDARFFFGRDKLIQRLQNHLQKSNFLAVLGPSGSGKSSVILAGLTPQLRLENAGMQLRYMTPTESPLTQLQAIIDNLPAKDTSTDVLIVDQFEELFTLCHDHTQRKTFLAQLLSITNFRFKIITMRADFLGDCAAYPDLAEAVQTNLQLIAPMTTVELRSAMEQQANQVHLRFEADLSHTILSEVEGEPGAMPLLQHLLRQLWERRHGRWLLSKEYRNLGGIRKAIAHTADELYKSVSDSEQDQLRYIFVRLTRIGDEATGDGTFRDTRQRIQQSTLEQQGVDIEQLRNLINLLATKRLVVTRQTGIGASSEVGTEVEVSHEALIRHWPRLQAWLNEDRIGLRLRQSIEQAALEWEQEGRPDNLLPRWNSRLETIAELSKQPNLTVDPLGQAYLDACIELRDREEAERNQREQELRVSLERAERQTRIATAERLAIHAKDQLAADGNQVWNGSLLLAREAVLSTYRADKDVTVNADAILRHLVHLASPLKIKIPRNHHRRAIMGVYWCPHGTRLLTVSLDETARVWNANTNEQIALFVGHEGSVLSGDWCFNGEKIVTCSVDRTARIWDAKTGDQLLLLSGHKEHVSAAVWSPTGDRIVTTCPDGTAIIWDAIRGEQILQLQGERAEIKGATWSPDGEWIAIGGKGKLLRIWNTRTGELAFEYESSEDLRMAQSVSWHPHSDRIVTGDWDGTIRIWRVNIIQQNINVEIEHSQKLRSGINSVRWSPDGNWVAVGDFDSGVHVWGTDMKVQTYYSMPNIPIDERSDQPIIRMQDRGAAISWHPTDLAMAATALQYKSYNYQVFMHELSASQPKEFFLRHSGPIRYADWSVDNTRIATCGDDGTIRIWDGKTGKQHDCLRGHTGRVQSVKFSSDGKYILSGGQDQTVRLWDAHSGQQIAELNDHSGWVNSVAWSPDSTKFVTADSDGIAIIWDAQSRRIVHRLAQHTSWVLFAAFSPDSRLVITTSRDHTAQIWNCTTGEQIHPAKKHTDQIMCADWHPNGKLVVTVGLDRRIRIWHLDSAESFLDIEPGGELHAVAWNPKGNAIAAAGKNSGIRIFNAHTGERLSWIVGYLDLVHSLSWRHDDQAILSASHHSVVSIWNARQLGEQWLFDGHSSGVTAVAWHPENHAIATATETLCQIWDMQTGEQIGSLIGHEQPVTDVQWSTCGKFIATSSKDGTARLWEADSGKELHIFQGHEYYVLAARFAPDDQWIATASDDSTVRIWDIQNGDQLYKTRIDSGFVTSVAWNTKGQLALATSKGAVLVWDIDSQTIVAELCTEENTVNSVAWSPDNSRLVAAYGGLMASQKASASIWDVDSGEKCTYFTEHTDRVLSLAWAPFDDLIASASADNTIRIWDAKSGKQLRLLKEHTAEVNMVDWSADGKWLVSASGDGTARVWPASISELLTISKSLISRDPPVLTKKERALFNITRETESAG